MKTFLILLLLTSLTCLASSQMQIHAHHDSKGLIDSYEVHTWNGPDQSMIVTKYTIQEAQDKFGKLLNSTEAGTSKTPDRITLIYNDGGELESSTAQVLSVPVDGVVTGKLEDKPKSKAELSEVTKTDAATAKEDVEAKTGKTIDGKSK